MLDAANKAYGELETVLDRLAGVLHGIYAVSEFADDKHSIITLTSIAQELREEATELADDLYKASRPKKTDKAQTQ